MSPSHTSPSSESQMAAWRESLRHAPPSAFPRRLDITSNPVPSALLRRKIILPKERLPTVSTETVLQAAWALVNVHYSNSEDVVYGLALIEADEENDHMVDDTQQNLTSLPARFTLREGETVQVCLDDVAAQTVSLISVAQSTSRKSSASLGPDYAAAAAFDNQLIIFSDMMGTQDVVLDRALNVECTIGRQGVMARAFYDPAVVDASTMQRILATFEALIHQLSDAASLSIPIEKLRLTSPQDVAQLSKWNNDLRPASNTCMHHLVAQKVRKHPEAEAVCSSSVSLTYQELDDLADSLGRILVERGVGPNKIVPCMLEKTAWTAVVWLAILKAGGALVPLDPAHQWADTQGIIGDCEADFVICSETYAARFADHNSEAIVISESFLRSLPSSEPVSSSVLPTDAGYVIFTSGSTGKPKGIVCSHRAWCTNAVYHGAAEKYGPSTRVLQFSAYTFDVSISDIFTTLAFGGCVCVPSEAERMNDLAGIMNRLRATYVITTPSVMQAVRPSDISTLDVLVCGGEAMSDEFVATWAPNVNLMNAYGPAECASRITSNWKEVGDEGAVIGTAFCGAIWVTKSNDPEVLCPIGAIGELLVEGDVLADGYLANPTKTQEAFIQKPKWLSAIFPDRAQGKMYRTGDLVQYTTSGALRFLGRRDTQIKIHGVRLESSHIEAKIAAEMEADASVIVDKLVAAEKALLAAFITIPRLAAQDSSEMMLLENTPDIRSFVSGLQTKLLTKLPSYMVPNIFLPVTAIPLGATGKVDRRALQALAKTVPEESLTQFAASRAENVSEDEKPRTRTEISLSKLWASVLKISQSSISRQDSFFSLGGDSLLAIKLVTTATQTELNLSVADVFQHPELAQLGAHLDSSHVVAADLKPVEPFALIGGAATFHRLREHLTSAYKIAARRVEDVFPCTPMQAGMMAENIALPEAYIIQEVLELSPEVDVDRLQTAWEDVIMTYPIMRTRIVMLPKLGSCQMVMSEDEPVEWQEGSNLTAYLSEDKSNHMDYGDNLSRLAIIEQHNGSRYLVWTCHNAITDGANHQNILRLAEQSYSGGQLSRGTDFNQFIQYLEHKDSNNAKQYWSEQFANISSVKFPAYDDEYEPAVTKYIDHDITLPRNAGVTSSILLRASWAFVLSQLTASPNFILGVTQSGRDIHLAGIETCLGPVLSTVPVAISMEDTNMTCGQFLTKIQKQYVDMIPYQHSGIQNIRKASSEASEACNFHSSLVVQPAPGKPSELFVPAKERNTGGEQRFGVMLECLLQSDSRVTVHAGFDSNIITTGEVEILVHRLEHVVSLFGAAINQNLPLSKIDIMSTRDLTILEVFNPEVPALEQCMHWLVEEQAKRRPGAIAIDSWDGELTFSQLLDYSDRLATHLMTLGVGPEVIVPFAFERSAWAVVAIHAILRAGGVCVALDMAHPRTRHEKIVADAEARVIVASTKHASSVDLVPHVVAVSRQTIESLVPDGSTTKSQVSPRNAAFVVYSSGSTGTPKGSILEHRSLCSTSRTNSEVLGVGPSTRAIAFASYSFDVAIEESVIIPMYGGTICIPSEEERLNDLPAAMRRMDVNWADLTPTVGRMLTPHNVPSLRTLVLGGEALTKDIIDTWAGKIGLFNTYGPSECSIQCTSSASLVETAMGANIGRAVNCKLWVVDAEDPSRLLPPGSVGELLIEGPIVGRGYLKEPTKTKAAFISGLPWASAAPGSPGGKLTLAPRRFYRTGDLARVNDDGTLDCLGRQDTQIKLSGQRIELGEIEFNIKKASPTPEATVVVEAFAPKGSDRKLLAAFIQSEGGHSSPNMVLSTFTDVVHAELKSLKSKIGDKLPAYMVPSLFVPVESLPMNTSGKIDRKKLREAASVFDQSQLSLYTLGATRADKSALGSDAEEKLAAMWAEVLHIDVSKDPIGAEDNFLELGGDSITAMQLVGRAKARGMLLSVHGIMKNARLAEMAAAAKPSTVVEVEKVKAELVAKAGPAAQLRPYTPFSLLPTDVALQSILSDLQNTHDIPNDLVEDIYPCTALQAGLMAITATDSEAYILRDIYTLPSGTDVNMFKAAWAAVVRKTPILRTRIIFINGVGTCQVVLDERLTWSTANSVEQSLEAAKNEPMGYGTPLSRWMLVTDESGMTKFVWSIHHALYDGFSLDLTLAAVDHAYSNALAVPTASPFVNFVRFLTSIDKEAVNNYWANLLANLELAGFPAVRVGHQCAPDNTVEHHIEIKSRKSGVTTATVVKAAWAVIVSRLSNSEDVVFGVTQFGRDVEVEGIEDMNGPTITTVPVSVKVDNGLSVSAFLEGVQKQSVEMIPFSHTGLQNIKKVSDEAREACNFQNLLVIQHDADTRGGDQSVFNDHKTATTVDQVKGFALVVECTLGNGTMSFSAHHDSSVIAVEHIQRLLRQFESVIKALYGNTQTVHDIEMVSDMDRKSLAAWNSAQPMEVNRCIHDIVSSQVQLQPDAPAIETREGSISFQQLEDLTTDLAHRLQALGVGPDTIVPICLEKSSNGIIAMMSIQKAGGSFAPLNPKDPTQRLCDLVEQVNAGVVIFSKQTGHLIPTVAAARDTLVLPATLSDWSVPLNTTPVASQVQPDNLAYILFTSGSTGKPKAVEIPHRSISSSVMGHAIAMGYLPGRCQRVLQFTSYTFDPCLIEIFTTLSHGGCICIPEEQERMNNLPQFIRDFRCDFAIFTPSLMRALKPEDLSTMKTIVVGGEPMNKELADLWGDRIHLINAYGPTETSIVCTSRTVYGPRTVPEDEKHRRPENIGRPVASLNWVVDPIDHNRLVPVGCIGELAVTGPILARGYLNNPEKTAEAFVSGSTFLSLFGLEGQKMYKTGDLVKQDPTDGTLLYIGRKDNQTKINGQRLELGEIEIQLKSKGANVEVAVVLAGKTKLDTKKQTLAAFVEFSDLIKSGPTMLPINDATRAKFQTLEKTMLATLPKYMVPTLWIPVSKTPTLADSGKANRKALAAFFSELDVDQLAMYGLARAGDSTVSRENVTEMEMTILNLVAKHLGRDAKTINPQDNFLRLGGDSIIAIQLVAAVRAMGITLTTEEIFRQPKICDMANNAKAADSVTEAQAAPVEPFSMLKGQKDQVLKSIKDEFGIPPTDVSDVLPCTPLQVGLVTMTIKDPDAYVLREIYRLPSKLDLDRFKASWNVVVRDACILRSRIVNLEDRGPFQVVMANGLEWFFAKSVKDYLEDDKSRPFKHGVPLCKLGLVESQYNGTYFILTIHHSLYDGWSKGTIMQKVEEAYESSTPEPTLAPIPEFKRFIEYLQTIDYDDTQRFWKDQFTGIEGQTFPRAPSADFEAILDGNYELDVPLNRLTGSAFTTSTILKAAWAIVLAQYTGSSEALFGIIQTGRHAPIDGISDMIGPTLTTVPLRIKLGTQTSMEDFLQSVQDQNTEMIKHEQTGLQNISRMSPECREACAFTNIMVIQPGSQDKADFFGGQQIQGQDKSSLQFSLGIECTLQEDYVEVKGAYDQRLIAESQMERILNQFKAAAQQINLETQDTISDIDLFSPEDWDEMIDMNKDVPSDVVEVTHEVIHRVALKASDSIAVNAWDIDLVYWELDYLSSVLAHHLLSLGVGPETIVPLCFEKSGWAVVALLGVIKAGGAFVFLDPSYPIARLTEIVNQTEAKILLSSLATSSLWKSSDLHVQIVDNVAIELLPSVTGMPETDVTPHNALYVIFTSGSTGKPKGCVIEHHSFLTCASAQASRANISASSRILQGASYSFDVSVMEMLTALSVGACICIPNEKAKNRSITDVINDFKITWTFLTPSVAKFLKPEDVPTIKTLVLGGEALTTQNIQTWADHVQLINGYGPSECTIAASANSNLTVDTDPANIGTALGGICWIVDPDDYNKLAPLGTVGELLIEGPIVARGYLNNPEKTEEVFVENPAWGEREPGEVQRLYKTGDLAYFSPDGNIMFIGRKDTQVKVRGQRMELGEIETHLSLNPEIQHAMVMYPKVGLCKQKLVGIISLKDFGATTNSTGAVRLLGPDQLVEASDTLAEITTNLTSLVPGYMVPNMWVMVESFPMLPSGKLNRKRVEQWLNLIDEATHHRLCGIGQDVETQLPQNALETELRTIWAEVLKLPADEIGTTQDFTALGGDSILAMVVLSKLRKRGSNISMKDMMKARNITKLASLVQQQGPTTTTMTAQPEVEEVTDEIFDLSPIQQYYANFTLKQTNYLSKQTNKRFNHTFCLRVKGAISAKTLSRALDALVERHAMLRARFVRDASAPCGWKQYVSTKSSESYHFRAWDNYTIDQVKPTIEKARLGLDVEKGPIMASHLVTVDKDNQYFFIVAHHLVVDLVSWNSILRDLEDLILHDEFTADKPYPFSAWAKLQREHAEENLPPQVAYPLKVPPANFSYWGMEDRVNIVRDVTSHSIVLSEKHTYALLQSCAKQYSAEPMDILCSALSHSFSRTFRDRETPAIYRYNHGRESGSIPNAEAADISSTVGWFTTLSPLHVRVSSKDDSLILLHRTVDKRQKIPANGFSYFASRYHNKAGLDPEGPFAGHENMEVTINYLGSSDSQQRNKMRVFEMPKDLAESVVSNQDQEVKIFSLFYISAEVREGKMHIDCEWNKRAKGQTNIEAWFGQYERCLVDLARRAAIGQTLRRRVVPSGTARKE